MELLEYLTGRKVGSLSLLLPFSSSYTVPMLPPLNFPNKTYGELHTFPQDSEEHPLITFAQLQMLLHYRKDSPDSGGSDPCSLQGPLHCFCS